MKKFLFKYFAKILNKNNLPNNQCFVNRSGAK